MKIHKLQDLDLTGKKVLLRVDFNVPLHADGTIADDTRLKESLPTIQYILHKGGSVILMSHLGRPKGKEAKSSLKPCRAALSELLKMPVDFAEDCIGPQAEEKAHHLQNSQVLLLENLRFHTAEEKPESDPSFAKKLANLGNIYVDDAFGAAHRNHSSITTIVQYFPQKAAAGLLLQKEIQFLEPLTTNPSRPFYAIIGGAKLSTKMGVLHALCAKVDKLLIGGGMAYTFYLAKDIPIGDSLCEKDQLENVRELLDNNNSKIFLPVDLLIAKSIDDTAETRVVTSSEGIPDGWQGVDIGPKTREEWALELQDAKTVFWNGPVGVFEYPQFAAGTKAIAQTLRHLDATTIVGGGDSLRAIHQMGLEDKFTHLSTGGGASLEFLESGHLPGIDVLAIIPK